MRVLEPKQLKNAPAPKKRTSFRPLVYLLILTAIAGTVVYVYTLRQAWLVPDTSEPSQSTSEQAATEHSTQKPLKQLSGDGFKELYQSIAYPNTQEIIDPPAITGDADADARIRARAETRGYKLSRIPMGAIVKVVGEPRLDGDDLLQPLAATAWYKLRDAARHDGHPISLISAYRSPQYQSNLFKQRLFATGVTIAQLASGAGDAAIDATLELTAVPGYSRHHTGYTVDFWCEDGSVTFLSSGCYKWINANNYQKAMEFGWIPSYPEGASEQGPEPEPWEFVWVGDAVRQ